MAQLLDGKSAVVTGAGRGIGREIALALAREGARVVVNDLGCETNGAGSDPTPANEVVAEIRQMGGTAVANYDTVADFQAAERIIKACVDNFGRIDILVNVAGIGTSATQVPAPVLVDSMPEKDWDDMVAVHLKGTFNCCRHALTLMRQQNGGRIINTVSDAWRIALLGTGNYSAAKGGIVSLSRVIALEMKLFGVTCNAVAPAADTRLFRALTAGGFSPEAVETAYQAGMLDKWLRNLMLDMAGPEHIPAIVVYLASDHAANITGRFFGASRGRVALYSEPEEIKVLYKEGVWTPEELVELVPRTLMVGIT